MNTQLHRWKKLSFELLQNICQDWSSTFYNFQIQSFDAGKRLNIGTRYGVEMQVKSHVY